MPPKLPPGHGRFHCGSLQFVAATYKRGFGLEEKNRGENGTIYLSDGFVNLALITTDTLPWGIYHFGFQVASVKRIEERAQTTAEANLFGAVAESWIHDPERNRVDASEHGWLADLTLAIVFEIRFARNRFTSAGC